MPRSLLPCLLLLSTLLASSGHALVPVAPSPLAGTGDTDGPNVLLALSIEFPTAGWAYQPNSARPSDKVFTPNVKYIGYFNNNLCYEYSRELGYFYAVAKVNEQGECQRKWAGNLLNWATASAIDIFRLLMTGGYRSIDTESKTVLRQARSGYAGEKLCRSASKRSDPDGDGRCPNNYYMNDEVAKKFSSPDLAKYSPYDGGVLLFRRDAAVSDFFGFKVHYNQGGEQSFSMAVEVCNKEIALGVPHTCKAYPVSGGKTVYKPEGLIQKYAKTMRVGVFSYLLDNDYNRDGGVMRARLKYPGCNQTVTTNSGNVVTLGQEWNPKTGIFYANPDATDASNTQVINSNASGGQIKNSGVVNYLNSFGENGYKSYDPAAELYYSAQRYLRNKGNYAAYSNISDDRQKDSFPVITDWDDPLKSSDQNSFIIYIGDTNVHADIDLPGSSWGTPRVPTDDQDLNVSSLLSTVRAGWSNRIGSSNSPGYLAALAYWGNVVDIRSDKSGPQRVKSFMIDTVEGGWYTPPNCEMNPKTAEVCNSFYLAARWGSFDDSNGSKTPDRKPEWSTDLQAIDAFPDGVPDNYAPANNPEALALALNRAFRYAALAVKPSLSGLATSAGSNVVNTGSHLFRTTFERPSSNSGTAGADWYGDIEVYKVTLNNNVLNSSALTLDWSTKLTLESQLGSTAETRKIYAYDQTKRSGIAFDSGSSYLQSQIKLDANGLAYLRGDNTNAGNNGTKAYRARSYRLGPIELAKVAFGGAPVDPAACGAFSGDTKNRPSIYAVPANDGFLHIFNYGDKDVADKGKELFAFMPSAVYPQAASLASKNYEYLRLHDGSPVIKDVCLGNVAKTLLIGSSGRGITTSEGNGSSSIYAIDVTNPGSMDERSVRWEFSSANDSSLGNMMTLPKLVKLNNGKWAAVLGNGINQAAGNAGVFLLMLDTAPGESWQQGRNYFKLTVSADNPPLYSPNGITDVSTYDDDGNGTADYLYAGDLNGQVWKFDISAANPASWAVALGGKPLFTAHRINGVTPGERQPITAAPVLMKTAGGQKVVVFGTGINYAEIDRAADGQAIYGVYDNNAIVGTPLDLLALAMPSADSGFSRTSSGTPSSSQKGWYFPLTLNEQVVSSPFYLSMKKNDLVVIDSIRLRQECAAGGEASFRTIVSLASGAAPDMLLMDTSGDGKVTSSDTKYNRQSLSTGVNYGGTLRVMLPGAKQALCNTGAGGTIECNTLGSGNRTVKRVSWRELVVD